MRRFRAWLSQIFAPASPRTAVLLFLGIFLFCGISPVGTSNDSRWSVFIALNLWRHQHVYLDDFDAQMRAWDYYALERIDGHWYSIYPLGGPVLSAPLILAQVAILRPLQPFLARFHFTHPVMDGFIHAQPEPGYALFEKEAAAFVVGLATALTYLIARGYLVERRAILLAFLFGLGTSVFSIAARALWQHTWSILLLTLIIYLLERARQFPSLAAWAGLPVAISYTVRPTNALFVVVFTLYVAFRHRRQLPAYLLAAAPIAAVFFIGNWSIYHKLFSAYQTSMAVSMPGFSRALEGLACNMISPARGLLVFTPVFLFSIVSLAKRSWTSPLAPWLAFLALAHFLLVAIFSTAWWAGHTYGPRYLTDIIPILILGLIPVLQRWETTGPVLRIVFVAFTLVGLAIHQRGGWSGAGHEWNVKPVNVDQHTERVWDWRDPPWLR
ncbi:MAG TPA: hypothetical protein VGP79_00725 [Bryobacteraceae bacterium]|jgi:hypothetical protein|nr:hypothetical protein [Bryobacteraceae bacterium]